MKTIVIAEIGENHYGWWEICRGMVEAIAKHDGTYAEFQTYTAVHVEMQKLCAEKGVRFYAS
jgi:sialic acid synthase SpsE